MDGPATTPPGCAAPDRGGGRVRLPRRADPSSPQLAPGGRAGVGLPARPRPPPAVAALPALQPALRGSRGPPADRDPAKPAALTPAPLPGTIWRVPDAPRASIVVPT